MKLDEVVVVDTNVILIANEQHSDISPEGVVACIERLQRIRTNGSIAIDSGYEILKEYGTKAAPFTGNRVGDAFLKWLYQNVGNVERVCHVPINTHAIRGYEQFPDDPELVNFDREDRKFVAVTVSHPDRPVILQGSDSKWLSWAKHLARHAVRVEFLCPKDVAKFENRRQARQRRPRRIRRKST
ncbi:MAG: hypothetical protein ACLGSD_14110 [Acidobacteriota bacterium]